MKSFNKLSMVLFDSTNASFKLSIEANFTKTNQTGGYSPLVYVSNSGTANLNPNIYLLFQYKSETYDKGNSLYMSYPQLFRVREALESIKELVYNGSGFTTVSEGGVEKIVVKQEYAEPVVLANIGKQSKWLSFKLVVMQTTEDGITKPQPGVSIEISSANGYASVLSVEEFLTIYTIVKDLNLSQLQALFSFEFLACDDFGMGQQIGGYQPQYQPRPMPGQYQQPQRQGPVYPRYNTAPQQRPVPAGRQISGASMPAGQQVVQQSMTAPVGSAFDGQNLSHSKSVTLPPRQSSSLMNFSSIESTPAEEVSFDFNDDAAIDEIFKED